MARQHTATHCNSLHYTATRYSTLQHTTTHLQHSCNIAGGKWAVGSSGNESYHHTATRCSTLHCNILQHICNTTASGKESCHYTEESRQIHEWVSWPKWMSDSFVYATDIQLQHTTATRYCNILLQHTRMHELRYTQTSPVCDWVILLSTYEWIVVSRWCLRLDSSIYVCCSRVLQ